MSEPIDLSQQLELRNPEGKTVGVLLPNKVAEDLAAERDRLRREAEQLRAEVQALKQALEAAREEVKDKQRIAAERDEYLKIVYAMTWKEVSFTPEELADMEKNGVEIGEVIEQIERDFAEGASR